MKKMLAKAVALSLVLGGVGFVANDALAADISDGVKVFSGTNVGLCHDVKTETVLEKDTALANQKDLVKVNDDVETNKANINTNKNNIAANQKAIDKEVKDRQDAITQERNARTVAELNLGEQITQEKNARVEADNKLGEDIKANKEAIKNEEKARKYDSLILGDNITKEKNAREEADNKLSEAIKNEEKARKYDSLILDDKITQEKNARIDADKAEAAARKDADNALRTDLNQETIDRVDADNRLQTAINQKADKTTVAENTAAIESNKAAIAQEKKDRDHADQKLQDQITINKGQIENEATNRANEDKRIEAKFDGEVSRLDGRIDKLDANVEKVGAMAAAIANLHTMGYDPEAPTEIAVGVGQYRDKTGLALGAFHYPNRDFMLSFNVSTAGDEFMGGIGATWRFGRKSPEELRQAEAEKAAKAKLAKAEAAKKAAKDARVAAQQKRHAEMLAARTGK